MNRPANPPNDWSPNETFERFAREHGRSAGELRARLGQLADQSVSEERHLSFEVLRDFELLSGRDALTDEDRSHLERCAFCSELLATLEAPLAHVEEFATAAVAAYETQVAVASAPTRIRHQRLREWGIAAGFAVLALAMLVTWQTSRISAGQLIARISPALAVKLASDPNWSALESTCTRESGEQSGCAYLATAARFRADGKARAARAVLVSGLEEVGVTPSVAAKVGDALQTPTSSVPKERQEAAQLAHVLVHNTDVPTRWIEAARLQLKAGEKLEALHAVDMYLVAVDTKPAATEAFRAGFVRTVAALDSERKPTSEATRPVAAAAASAVVSADTHD